MRVRLAALTFAAGSISVGVALMLPAAGLIVLGIAVAAVALLWDDEVPR
jgi:hypothetical protein